MSRVGKNVHKNVLSSLLNAERRFGIDPRLITVEKIDRNVRIELIDSVDHRFYEEEKFVQEKKKTRFDLPFAQAKQSLIVRKACSPVGLRVLQ